MRKELADRVDWERGADRSPSDCAQTFEMDTGMRVAGAASLQPQINRAESLLKVDRVAGFNVSREGTGGELGGAGGEEGRDLEGDIGLAVAGGDFDAGGVQPAGGAADLVAPAGGGGIDAFGIFDAGKFFRALGGVDDRVFREWDRIKDELL